MGLPSIGPLELIIVAAIALLVVGPSRLPDMGKAFGRTIREFRDGMTGVSLDGPADPPAAPGATPEPESDQVAASR